MSPTGVSTDLLAAFVQVADESSVTAAAAKLGASKAVVSKRIAQLEAALRATLFSRTTRRVALTAAGEAYLEFARRALAEVAQGEERLRDLRAELSGSIRMTASVSWGQRVLAPCLPEFLLRHPGIEIELLLADRIMDIAYERIDLALRWTSTPSTPEVVSVPVATVAWVIAAAPAYLDTAGTPSAPKDLAAHHCMGYWRESSDDGWVLTRGTRRQQVRVKSRFHANNPESVAEAALAALGIGLLPTYVCAEALSSGRLVQVLPAWTPQTRFGQQITAVAAPERMRLVRNQVLLSFLRQRLGDGPAGLTATPP